MLTIQSPVSRVKSCRTILCKEAWSRGISNFFIEEIPFSYSASLVFAERLVSVIKTFLDQQDEKKTFHLYELGAGMGMLSKHILDVLLEDHPHLYSRVKVHVSDGSKENIDQVKQLEIFKQHKKQLSFDVVDCLNPKFNPKEPPHMVLMSYLLDSLDARHIEVRDGELFELYVKTEILEDDVLVDTGEFPPKIVTTQDIKTLLLSKRSSKRRHLLSKLSDLIKETYEPVPIFNSDMTIEEKEVLTSYVNKIKPKKTIRFNFSYSSIQALKTIFEACPDEAMVMVYDFGFTIKNPNFSLESLTAKYGVFTFCNVFFPHISDIAEAYHFKTIRSKFPQNHSQMAVYSRGAGTASLEETFKKVFKKEGAESVFNAENGIKKHIKKETFLEKVQEICSSLSAREKETYSLRMAIALESYKKGFIKQAKHHADILVERYKEMAISAYCLLGEIAIDQKEFNKAEQYLSTCIELAEWYPKAYNQLSLAYGFQGKKEAFIDIAKKNLFYSTYHIIWDHLLTIALVHTQLKQTEDAEKILQWILQTHDHYPDLLPTQLVKKTKTFLEVVVAPFKTAS